MGFKLLMQLDGMEQLLQRLETLKKSQQRRVIRPAVTQAGTPVLKSARKHVRRELGELKRSLGKKVVANPKRNTVVCIVGPRTGRKSQAARPSRYSSRPVPIDPANYAHLVEFGTTPHRLTRVSKKLTVTEGQHPGAKAHPFLRPALEENRGQVQSILATKIGEGLEKLARGQ